MMTTMNPLAKTLYRRLLRTSNQSVRRASLPLPLLFLLSALTRGVARVAFGWCVRFVDYNFREYFKRNVQHKFRTAAAATAGDDRAAQFALIVKAQKDLAVLVPQCNRRANAPPLTSFLTLCCAVHPSLAFGVWWLWW